MTANEISVEDKLKYLAGLQNIDSKLDQIRILKGELPIEVQDLEDEITGLDTRISNLQGGLKEIETKILAFKTGAKESQALIKKYEKQQKNVKNNREYEALSKELELQTLEIQLLEKKTNDSKGDADRKQESIDEAKGRLKEKKKELKAKKVELDQIIEKTEKEENSLKRKSTSQRKKIEERLLKGYDKIRKAYRNGLAVVEVERNSCGGCFNKVPPQLQLEIKQRTKIILCEHCSRVLIDSESEG